MDYNIEQEGNSDEEELVPADLLHSVTLPALEFECSLKSHLVRITHIESPSNFHVMLEENVQYFEMFSENMNQFYAKDIFSPTVNELPVGSYWCVNIDGCWRRAEISSNIGKLKPSMDRNPIPFYQVFLVDRGSIECVSLDQVRFMDDQFTVNPPMAIPCILSDVYPLTQLEDYNWHPDVIHTFMELCCGELHWAVLWAKKLSLHYECILEKFQQNIEEIGSPTINEMLALDGYATSTVLEEVVNDNILENIKEGGEEEEDVEISPVIVENGKESSSDNGMPDSLSQWNPMVEHQEEADTLLNDTDPENFFLGYKNEDEKNICSYIRYNKPCQRGENCKWLHIKPRDDGLPSGAEEVFTSLKCPPIRPIEGDVCRAMVLTATSPSMFYTLFETVDITGIDKLSELQDNLTEAYQHEPPKPAQTIPALGELMVLHQSDGDMPGYYRIRVIELVQRNLGVMVKVLYIDYGKEEWVKECQLRAIFECFLYTPAQAIECFLFDVTPKNDRWNQEAIECFNELVDGKFGSVTVLSVDNITDRYGLELEFREDVVINVNSTLIDRGHADCDD